MTLFNRNPYDCDDLDELREWVVLLREMLLNRQEVNRCSREMVELLQHANSKQGEQIALLEQQVDLLKQRLEQYEVAFSAGSVNHVRRLN